MQKPVFIWKNFDKCAKTHNRFNFAFIKLSYFRNFNNRPNSSKGSFNGGFIYCENINHTYIVYFLNDNGTSGCVLNFLDYFTSGAN